MIGVRLGVANTLLGTVDNYMLNHGSTYWALLLFMQLLSTLQDHSKCWTVWHDFLILTTTQSVLSFAQLLNIYL